MPNPARSARGFSLVESMICLALLLIISSAAFSALLACQKVYRSLDAKADMYSGVRAASEMLTQEIGQAGLLSFSGTTLGTAVTANTSAQSISLASASGVFVGEKLLVDAGTAEETVSVTAINGNYVTGIFKNSHSSGAPVNAAGVFPEGILSSSTGTELRIFGDINGDGTLVYVRYDCDTSAGTLTRSVTPITSSSANPSQVLLQGLVANPNASACFQYTTSTAAGYTFVTSVGITLTVQTTQKDMQTGQYATMTNTFGNLGSRNILSGLTMANAGLTSRLQPTPPGLPLS